MVARLSALTYYYYSGWDRQSRLFPFPDVYADRLFLCGIRLDHPGAVSSVTCQLSIKHLFVAPLSCDSYVRQGGYVFVFVYLFVCLPVCVEELLKNLTNFDVFVRENPY